MNRKGDWSLVRNIILWMIVIAIVSYIIVVYLVRPSGSVLGPLDGLFGGS